MFGWINDCTESLVTSKFGIDKWHEIKRKAGCEVKDDSFVRHKYYSDQSTVELLVAASEVLDMSVEDVLEAFGQYFMEFTRRHGYDNLLSCQGSTLRLWLSNLNALHDHLQSSLPAGFIAPVFWCEDDDYEGHEGCILLHYYSQRGSLLVPLVVGIVKEVSRYHFNIEVSMERLQIQTENDAKFTTWRIRAVDPVLQWKLTKSSENKVTTCSDNLGEDEVSPDHACGVCPFAKMSQEMRNEQISTDHDDGVSQVPQDCHDQDCNTVHGTVSMSGNKMREVFPYHVVVDSAFRIIQYGKQLPGIIGQAIVVNEHIETYLEIKRPVLGTWDWKVLQKLEDQTFFLEPLSANSIAKDAKFKANIVHLSSEPKQVMFVISPDVKNVAELHAMNLTMSDLPLHSFQRDAVFLGEHMYSEVRSAHNLETLSNKLKNERNLSNTLLFSMLPKDVALSLRNGQIYEPQHHENVTLFFSDVIGFTEMCSELAPWEVVDVLNTLYTIMDFLVDRFGLYKVETIGDAYMCCSGLPVDNDKHAENVANFALAVKACVSLVKSPYDGEPIRLRMGIHTGNCMSGVVGNLTPRYCLFGDMINTTSRHESTCLPDKIQVSSITYGRIMHFSEDQDHYIWSPRGLVDMKGKGEMYTYWLDNGSEKNPHVGPEPMERLVKELEEFLATKTWKKRNYFGQRRKSTASTSNTSTSYTDYQLMVNDSEVPDFLGDEENSRT